MVAKSKAQQALAGMSKTKAGRAKIRARGKNKPIAVKEARKLAKAPGGTTKGLPAKVRKPARSKRGR